MSDPQLRVHAKIGRAGEAKAGTGELPKARLWHAAVALALLLAPPVSGAETPGSGARQAGLLRLGEPRPIVSAGELYRPMGLAVGPDGSLVIADAGDQELVKVSPEGDLIWRVGREGEGPGEFLSLYRVAVGGDGTIAAFDFRKQEVSWFEPDGTFVHRDRLGLRMRQVGGMVLLAESHLALVGFAPSDPSHSIHPFDADLEHLTSFGPMPPNENAEVFRFWLPGFLHSTEAGNLLFTLNIPYRIHRFSPEGNPLEEIERPFGFEKGPEDSIVRRSLPGGKEAVSGSREFVPHPAGGHDLGDGWVLGHLRNAPERTTWDLFHAGELVESFPAPEQGCCVSAVDRGRRLLYIKSETAAGDSIYLQIPYEIRLPSGIYEKPR